jgi:hypothetical protein
MGCYGFIKPVGLEEFNWFGFFENNTSLVVQASNYRIDGPSAYLVINPVTDVLGSVYPALSFHIQHSLVLEFITEDQWYEAEFPMVTTAQCEKAEMILHGYDVFHENPLHLKELAATLGNGVRKHAHAIGGALSVLFPAQAPAIAVAAHFLQS